MKITTIYLKGVTLSFMFLISTSYAQIINSIAGTGVNGYTGDGGQATLAQIHVSTDVAVDAAGNIYFTDKSVSLIRKINTSGVITTVAGNGTSGYSGDGIPAISAQLNYPNGITLDAAGNLYIADGLNYRVRKVDAVGIITTIAGTGVMASTGDGGLATAADLERPFDLGFDAAGNLYICDRSAHKIRMVNPAGIISTVVGTGIAGSGGDGGLATMAQINYPDAMTVDGAGNIYIASDERIRKVNTAGIISTFAGTGVIGFSGDGGPATAALMSNPYGLAIDGGGNVYISAYGNSRIRKVNTLGIITTEVGGPAGCGGDGASALAAGINGPYGITFDAAGNLLIADGTCYKIRKVTQLSTPVAENSISKNIRVFPNPCSSLCKISIESQQNELTALKLTNILGEMIFEYKENVLQPEFEKEINLQHLPVGVYFLEVFAGAEKTIKKIIKE